MGLLLRGRYRKEFCTLSGWKFEAPLFWRLMRFGLPNGLQWMLDASAKFLIGEAKTSSKKKVPKKDIDWRKMILG